MFISRVNECLQAGSVKFGDNHNVSEALYVLIE